MKKWTTFFVQFSLECLESCIMNSILFLKVRSISRIVDLKSQRAILLKRLTVNETPLFSDVFCQMKIE